MNEICHCQPTVLIKGLSYIVSSHLYNKLKNGKHKREKFEIVFLTSNLILHVESMLGNSNVIRN